MTNRCLIDSSAWVEAGRPGGDPEIVARLADLMNTGLAAMIESIKKVCKDLLAKLKTEKLVLAWRTKRTTRAAVRVEIEKMLDSGLPEKYTTDLFETKCGALFQHVLEKYPESGESVYQVAG
jgi:hypothetical protein